MPVVFAAQNQSDQECVDCRGQQSLCHPGYSLHDRDPFQTVSFLTSESARVEVEPKTIAVPAEVVTRKTEDQVPPAFHLPGRFKLHSAGSKGRSQPLRSSQSFEGGTASGSVDFRTSLDLRLPTYSDPYSADIQSRFMAWRTGSGFLRGRRPNA